MYLKEELRMFKRANKESRKSRYKNGDIVEVQSKEVILSSLDSRNSIDGLPFYDQMFEYCDCSFEIIKVVNNCFDEHKCRMYKVIAPLYLLDGIMCRGNVESFNHDCDHSCYLFWHQEWIHQSIGPS